MIEIDFFGYELYIGPRREDKALERLFPVVAAAIPFLISRSGSATAPAPTAPAPARERDEEEEEEEEELPPLHQTLEEIAAERLDALEDKVADLNSYIRERAEELRKLELRAREVLTNTDLEPVLARFAALTDRVGSLEQKLRDILVMPRINHTPKTES